MLTVICLSRFGTHSLSRVLSAYEQLEPPRGGWKLVVVIDRNSPRSAAVLGCYASRLPLEIVRGEEPDFGLGLRHVEGDLVVFTDTTSIPASDWLSSLRHAADRHGEFSVFAGSTLPYWECAQAQRALAWEEQGAIYALAEPRADEGAIAPELIWAPNVSVRSKLLSAGLYPESTPFVDARRGPSLADTEQLIDRICSARCRTWYVPGAVVRQALGESPLGAESLVGQARRRGRAVAGWELQQGARRLRGAWRLLASAARQLCTRQLRLWTARLEGDLQEALRARWRRDLALGKLLEHQRAAWIGRP